MRTVLPIIPAGPIALITMTLSAMAPWLFWLDLNAMALRFVQLRGNWPMCHTAVPCRPTAFYGNNDIETIWHDPLIRLLDPPAGFELLVFLSPFVACALWFTVSKYLSPATRGALLATFLLGWTFLILDPTYAVLWYRD